MSVVEIIYIPYFRSRIFHVRNTAKKLRITVVGLTLYVSSVQKLPCDCCL